MIRPFRIADIDRVYDIERRSFTIPWPKFMFRRLHDRNQQGFLVAERNGYVIGYAIVEIMCIFFRSGSKRRGHLLNLAVNPRFRRQGVGNALVKSLILYLVKSEVEEVWLEVRVSNSTARKFYSKLGFKEIVRKNQYYWDEDALVMNLNIKRVRTIE